MKKSTLKRKNLAIVLTLGVILTASVSFAAVRDVGKNGVTNPQAAPATAQQRLDADDGYGPGYGCGYSGNNARGGMFYGDHMGYGDHLGYGGHMGYGMMYGRGR